MTSTDAPRPGPASAPAAEAPGPALSRPYLEVPAGEPPGVPLRAPRFTPRQKQADAARPAPPSPAAPPPPPPDGTSPARRPSRPRRRLVRRHDPSVRAVIGDEIRIPIMWCQFGSCIARYTDHDALGERDLRARAIAAGWRYDALGRLACPDCAQHDSTFWATRAPAPVTRYRSWTS